MVEEHTKLRWQNLIHKKCPQCDLRMVVKNSGFECPATTHRFFIGKKKFAEILTDPNHAAVRYLNYHEKKILNDALLEIGIVDTQRFWRAPAINDTVETWNDSDEEGSNKGHRPPSSPPDPGLDY